MLGSANLGGGGIQITGGNLNIVNSTIGGTSAPGAYAERTSTTTANLQAGSGGGVTFTPSAPRHMNSTGILTITGSTISRSRRNWWRRYSDLDLCLRKSRRHRNPAPRRLAQRLSRTTRALGTANGGGIVESLGTTVATTSFTNNSAGNRGGGVFVAARVCC